MSWCLCSGSCSAPGKTVALLYLSVLLYIDSLQRSSVSAQFVTHSEKSPTESYYITFLSISALIQELFQKINQTPKSLV